MMMQIFVTTTGGAIGVVGVGGGTSFSIVPFLLRTIFFCKAAASAAPPPLVRGSLTGEVGLEDAPILFVPTIAAMKTLKSQSSKILKRYTTFNRLHWLSSLVFFGVLTPVPGCPSLRGYWTFRVSRRSTVTHSSSRLLTKYCQNKNKLRDIPSKIVSKIVQSFVYSQSI